MHAFKLPAGVAEAMPQHEEEDEIELNEGMPVRNEEGEDLGTLAGMLQEEDEEEAEFVVVTVAGAERLIPAEAILGVGDGALVLDLPTSAMPKFPKVRGEGEISDAEIDLAYKMYDEHALGASFEEE